MDFISLREVLICIVPELAATLPLSPLAPRAYGDSWDEISNALWLRHQAAGVLHQALYNAPPEKRPACAYFSDVTNRPLLEPDIYPKMMACLEWKAETFGIAARAKFEHAVAKTEQPLELPEECDPISRDCSDVYFGFDRVELTRFLNDMAITCNCGTPSPAPDALKSIEHLMAGEMKKKWSIQELTQADAIRWLRKPCWSMGEALLLLNNVAAEGKNTVDFPPAPNAGADTDALNRAVIAAQIIPVGQDKNNEPAYAPRSIIKAAAGNNVGNWRMWDYLLFPPDLRQEIASQSHWSERELEALCQGVPPATYCDASTSESEWQPIRKEISEACKNGRLHAESTHAGNALYGGQWRIERVSAVRWAIGMQFPFLPEWLARHDLKEIWVRQDAEKFAAGRYTLREAAGEIARNTGERVTPLLTKLMRAAGDGSLPTYAPGSEQRREYGDEQGQASQVREAYEEVYWDDLNAWLAANEPRVVWRFPESERARRPNGANELTPAQRRAALDITRQRGCRRRILENWDKIEKLYGPGVDGRQVVRVLKQDQTEDEPALKTVQNHLAKLRKEKLIP